MTKRLKNHFKHTFNKKNGKGKSRNKSVETICKNGKTTIQPDGNVLKNKEYKNRICFGSPRFVAYKQKLQSPKRCLES